MYFFPLYDYKNIEYMQGIGWYFAFHGAGWNCGGRGENSSKQNN